MLARASERARERERERERELEDRGSLMATKYDDYDDEYLTRPYEDDDDDDDDELLRQLRGSNTTAAVTPERISSVSEPATLCHSPSSSSSLSPSRPSVEDPVGGGGGGGKKKKKKKKQLGRKSHSFAYRIREHLRMGPKLSETVKGKLSLGATILRKGGRENIFRHVFGMRREEGEKLLKASQCYLFTTAGPIAGILFISTFKIAFCSERSIPLPSPSGPPFLTTRYKVSIPIEKIKRAGESENANKPEDKYVEIVTEDGFEFWFMGFVRYEKAITNLHKAVSGAGTG